jgi:hypothetical protein
MGYPLIFAVVYFILGLSLVIFAKPLTIWDYKIDLRWKISFGIGVNFRIWFLRIAGILMMLTASFVLGRYWVLQIT